MLNLAVAEPHQNNKLLLLGSELHSQQDNTLKQAQQLVNAAEQLAQQRTISAQLQAIEKWKEARLQWQNLGEKNQEALTFKRNSSHKSVILKVRRLRNRFNL
jgi:predicted nucleotide-binding protein (sugar kinase/HSP70/actin superfamily)